MSLGEVINKRPGVWIGSIAGAVVVTLLFAVLQLRSGQPAVHLADRAFFTTDDGLGLFEDSISRIPPFEHDGAEAVRAYVFTCDGGQHRWVAYLGKYKPDAVKEVSEGRTTPGSAYLVKKPGPGDWLPQTDPAAAQIMRPKCPDGTGTGEPVEMCLRDRVQLRRRPVITTFASDGEAATLEFDNRAAFDRQLGLYRVLMEMIMNATFQSYRMFTLAAFTALFFLAVPAHAEDVKQAGDGTVKLNAENAKIVGSGAKIEGDATKNIGYWNDASDYLEWTINVEKPATFSVELSYALDSASEGTEVVLAAGDQKVTAKLAATSGWDDYKAVKLGTLAVQKAGTVTITLKATKKPGEAVMNFRTADLTPTK